MATSVLGVGGTFVLPGAGASPAGAAADLRRVPLAALAAGALGVVEALGLLAVALTGLDGVMAGPSRPAGTVLATGLLAMAGWIVLAAGSGSALIEGTGRRVFTGLALAETGLVALLAALVATTPLADGVPVPLPLPTLVLLAVALPVAKLVLAGAPRARQWAVQGPRVREVRDVRADPVAAHRLLATATLAVIGLGLVSLTALTPVAEQEPDLGRSVSSAVSGG